MFARDLKTLETLNYLFKYALLMTPHCYQLRILSRLLNSKWHMSLTGQEKTKCL